MMMKKYVRICIEKQTHKGVSINDNHDNDNLVLDDEEYKLL